MASSSSQCTVHTCPFSSQSLCHCCQTYLCQKHLKEHEDRHKIPRSSITDKINDLHGRLRWIRPNVMHDFEKWRSDAHAAVDLFFEKKSEELKETVDELQKQLNEEEAQLSQHSIKKISTSEDVNIVLENLRSIDEHIDELQHVRFHLTSLTVDDNLVSFRSQAKSFFPLDRPRQSITFSGSTHWPFAVSVKHLLTAHDDNLYLLDRRLTVVKKTAFNHGGRVRDLCWSMILSQFFIVNREGLFIFDEKSMILEQCKVTSDKGWACVACYRNTLLLSTDGWGSTVSEYSIRPTIRFVREWLPPMTCELDELISDLEIVNNSIAAIVFNEQTKLRRLELRAMETLERLWSIPIHRECFRCCSININQWLVIDQSSRQLLHLSSSGNILKIEKYDAVPLNAIQWEDDKLVIGTKEGINLHQLR